MRIGDSLSGKRVLITQADEFMGPVLADTFRAHGAVVIADTRVLDSGAAGEAAVRDAGTVDVLIANLGVPAPSTRAHQIGDDEWRHVFAHVVDPLPGLARGVLPQMLARRSGKFVVMGSSTAFRGQKRTATYSSARSAQVGFVRASAEGFDVVQPDERRLHVAGALEGRVSLRIAGPLALRVGLSGAAPFVRDAFVYRRADGTQADLFRMAPIVGLADVGVGVVIR